MNVITIGRQSFSRLQDYANNLIFIFTININLLFQKDYSLLYYLKIKLTFLYYSFIIICMINTNHSMTRWAADKWMAQAKIKPSNQRLLEAIFAVHATCIRPEEGLLKAGARKMNPKTGETVGFCALRKTVHFALGGMVQAHKAGNWESSKYAVVAPLGAFKDRWANLFPYDSFVVADLPLNNQCIIIVPKGDDYIPKKGEQIRYYDPSISKIRSVIDKVIRSEGGWLIQTYPDMGAAHSVATFKLYPQDNLCELSSWTRFLEAHPKLSFGPATYSLKGNICRLKQITLVLEDLETLFLHYRKATSIHRFVLASAFEGRWEFYQHLLRHNLKQIEDVLDPEIFLQLQQDVEKWSYIMHLENYVKKHHGGSLLDLEEAFTKEKLEKGGDFAVDRAWIDAQCKDSNPYRNWDYYDSSLSIGMQCAHLSKEEWQKFQQWKTPLSSLGYTLMRAMQEDTDEAYELFDIAYFALEIDYLLRASKQKQTVEANLQEWTCCLERKQALLPSEKNVSSICYLKSCKPKG